MEGDIDHLLSTNLCSTHGSKPCCVASPATQNCPRKKENSLPTVKKGELAHTPKYGRWGKGAGSSFRPAHWACSAGITGKHTQDQPFASFPNSVILVVKWTGLERVFASQKLVRSF